MNAYLKRQFALRGLGKLCLLWSLMASACGQPEVAKETIAATPGSQAPAPKTETVRQPLAEKQDTSAVAEPPPAAERKDVLYYFRNLPEGYALPYRIWQEDRLWMSAHTPGGKAQQAFVDLKNGYLEVVHHNSDTESENAQVALFRMADGSPVIAVCRSQAQKEQVQQHCYFLRPENESQLDWTEHTLPVFTPYDFFSPEAEARLDNEYLEDAFPILVKLPQYGTDLLVQLYLGRRFHYCSDTANEKEQALCPLFDEMERRSFTLKWNRQSGRFD